MQTFREGSPANVGRRPSQQFILKTPVQVTRKEKRKRIEKDTKAITPRLKRDEVRNRGAFRPDQINSIQASNRVKSFSKGGLRPNTTFSASNQPEQKDLRSNHKQPNSYFSKKEREKAIKSGQRHHSGIQSI